MIAPLSPAYSGAWLQEQGHGLAVLSAGHYATSHYFDDTGELQEQRYFRKYGASLYGEYGVSESLTVGGTLFLDAVRQADKPNLSLSNSTLFLRRPLYRDEARVITLQPLVKLPSLSRRDRNPRGGSTSADIELGILYGETLHLLSARDYLDTLAGLRWRSDGLSPQWRMEARAGAYLTETLILTAGVTHTQSIQPDTSPFAESGDLDFDLSTLEFGALYRYAPQRYLQATVYDHVAGAQTGSGRGFMLSYGVEF